MFILIGGPSGSGKTTASEDLAKHFEAQGKKVIRISLDDFYRDFSFIEDVNERAEKINFDDPASVDKELLHNVMSSLMKGEACQLPEHDYNLHTRKSTTHEINPAGVDVFIFEGIFALNRKVGLLALVDSSATSVVSVYMDTHHGICAARRFARDLALGRSFDSIHKQYTEVVVPMQNLHVEPTKDDADVVVENDNIAQIISHLKSLEPQEVFANWIHQEQLTAVSNSVRGWYGAFTHSATQALVSLEASVESTIDEYFGEEGAGQAVQPSTSAAPGK